MEHHFNTDIAKDCGIEEAILLHNFHFWLSKNAANEKHFHDGLYWFYNSKKAFVDLFPYMNETKIFRAIKNLEERGFIVKGNYNTDKWDRTNWYAITKIGLTYLQTKGYSISIFGTLFQNDTIDSGKMNDGALQNEQSILINNTYTNTDSKKEKEDILSSKKKNQRFVKPTIDDINAYIQEQGMHFNAESFFDYYESKGWVVGKSPMKDWKAACRTWESNRKKNTSYMSNTKQKDLFNSDAETLDSQMVINGQIYR